MSDRKKSLRAAIALREVSDLNSVAMHYRRCHICNEVSEVESGTVRSCASCGKVMAPFFFFEELEAPIASEFELRPIVTAGQHPPVRGLTAYW